MEEIYVVRWEVRRKVRSRRCVVSCYGGHCEWREDKEVIGWSVVK